MCVGVSGLGVGDIVLADTGIGDVELVAYGRRALWTSREPLSLTLTFVPKVQVQL